MRHKVIGIDPAPSKTCVICRDQGDGPRFEYKLPHELPAYIEDCRKGGPILICWDAPLTGPSDETHPRQGDFSKRAVETFFMTKTHKKRWLPKGVSMLPYCECPHWTITRHTLGLPRLGRYDKKSDFHLVHKPHDLRSHRHCVAEVHPTLALLLWFKGKVREWQYKNNQDTKKAHTITKRIATLMQTKLNSEFIKGFRMPCARRPDKGHTDDELDAFVAWYLGTLLVIDSPNVQFVGSQAHGSFLLPYSPGLLQSFQTYIQNDKPRYE